jgi:hypothetical protein
MVLVAAEVRSIEGEDKQDLIVRLPTTSSLVIPPGCRSRSTTANQSRCNMPSAF